MALDPGGIRCSQHGIGWLTIRNKPDTDGYGSLDAPGLLARRVSTSQAQKEVHSEFRREESIGQSYVTRHEALEMLYAVLAEEAGSALLHGEPGCGKSTVALKFAWQTQGAFDAVVFQLCGQRPVAEIAAELAAKLKLGLETKPPEEQIAAAKAWLAERRALLVLDDIWENDVKELAPGPPVSLLCTSRLRSPPWISPTYSLEVKSFSRGEAESIFRIYLGEETLGKHRDALLEFAERVERLPIAIVVGAYVLRRELDPVPEAARALRLERLRNEIHDVADLVRRAIAARPKQQRLLLNAMAVCALDGFLASADSGDRRSYGGGRARCAQ
jgi:hypothetical protein